MSIEQIKEAIGMLPPDQVTELATWLHQVSSDDTQFDLRIKADAEAGKLAWLAKEAKAEVAKGEAKPLEF